MDRILSVRSVALLLAAALPRVSHGACAESSSCTAGSLLLQKKSSTVLKPIKSHDHSSNDSGDNQDTSWWWYWEDEEDEKSAVSADKLKAKMGLIGASPDLASNFPHASWYYDYRLVPKDPERARWAKSQGQEYVGMFNNKLPLLEANPEHGLRHDCFLTREPQCTIAEVNEAIRYTKSLVDMHWVMGPNEPYQKVEHGYGNKDMKWVSPRDAAAAWATLVQPAAEAHRLKLVSPTTGVARKKQKWIADFFRECWELRGAELPCSVERIDAISVHEHMCTGHWWHQNYDPEGREGRNWYKKMINDLKRARGFDWASYIKHENVWVTETSCNEEANGRDCQDDFPQISQDSCLKITGQYKGEHHGHPHQQGSIKTMLEMENVKRFAWFSTSSNTPIEHPNWNKRTGSRMVEMDGQMLPIGRAFQGLLDGNKVDCSLTRDQCDRAKRDLADARDAGKGAAACSAEDAWDSSCR